MACGYWILYELLFRTKNVFSPIIYFIRKKRQNMEQWWIRKYIDLQEILLDLLNGVWNMSAFRFFYKKIIKELFLTEIPSTYVVRGENINRYLTNIKGLFAHPFLLRNRLPTLLYTIRIVQWMSVFFFLDCSNTI